MYDKVMVSNPKSKSIESKFNHEYLKFETGIIAGQNFIIIKNIMVI